jgi:hypothetical protein
MTGLAGWLFADLLLVLFITAFATTTTPSAPPKPQTSPQHHVSKPPPHQSVLVLRPVNFVLPVPQPGIVGTNGGSSADRALANELKSALQAHGLNNTRAGLVEAFGWSPSPSGDGVQVATAANLSVAHNLPLFSEAFQQSFWTSGADGTVTLKVFFFARD